MLSGSLDSRKSRKKTWPGKDVAKFLPWKYVSGMTRCRNLEVASNFDLAGVTEMETTADHRLQRLSAAFKLLMMTRLSFY